MKILKQNKNLKFNILNSLLAFLAHQEMILNIDEKYIIKMIKHIKPLIYELRAWVIIKQIKIKVKIKS